MTGALALDRELARWPDAIDLFVRRATSLAFERRGRVRRREERREVGVAVRRRLPSGGEVLQAWSADPGSPAAPGGDAGSDAGGDATGTHDDAGRTPPGSLLDALPAAAADGLDLRLQDSRIETELARADGGRFSFAQSLALLRLSLRHPRGDLSRTRLASGLRPEDLAADVAALLEAGRLAARARPMPTPGRITLEAAVAARVLASLWLARPSGGLASPPSPPLGAAMLIDDAASGQGPLGAPRDGQGLPTRRVVLAGPGAEPAERLGWLRPSFTDHPVRAPRNLRLVALRPPPPGAASFRAIEVAESTLDGPGTCRFLLLGEEAHGGAGWVTLRLDLEAFLAGIEGGGGETWWTPALGSAGAPFVVLRS